MNKEAREPITEQSDVLRDFTQPVLSSPFMVMVIHGDRTIDGISPELLPFRLPFSAPSVICPKEAPLKEPNLGDGVTRWGRDPTHPVVSSIGLSRTVRPAFHEAWLEARFSQASSGYHNAIIYYILICYQLLMIQVY